MGLFQRRPRPQPLPLSCSRVSFVSWLFPSCFLTLVLLTGAAPTPSLSEGSSVERTLLSIPTASAVGLVFPKGLATVECQNRSNYILFEFFGPCEHNHFMLWPPPWPLPSDTQEVGLDLCGHQATPASRGLAECSILLSLTGTIKVPCGSQPYQLSI